MRQELKKALIEHSAGQIPLLVNYLEKNYGECIQSAEDVIDFARRYRYTPWPDDLFLPDPGKNIGVSLHDPVSNGLVHSHEFFELIYVEKGEIIDCVDETEYVLPKGSVCLHNPNAHHCIKKCGADDCVVNIMIREETFEENIFLPIIHDSTLSRFFLFFSAAPDSPHHMIFHPNDVRIGTVIDLIAEEFLDPNSNEKILLSLLFVLAATLLKRLHGDTFTERLILYLSENIENATLSECAAYFQYHEKYFSALVKKKTQKSFRQILTELRIKQAKDLLVYTDMTISDIASKVGYSDPPIFYANFKKYTEMTPAEYRNNICNNALRRL